MLSIIASRVLNGHQPHHSWFCLFFPSSTTTNYPPPPSPSPSTLQRSPIKPAMSPSPPLRDVVSFNTASALPHKWGCSPSHPSPFQRDVGSLALLYRGSREGGRHEGPIKWDSPMVSHKIQTTTFVMVYFLYPSSYSPHWCLWLCHQDQPRPQSNDNEHQFPPPLTCRNGWNRYTCTVSSSIYINICKKLCPTSSTARRKPQEMMCSIYRMCHPMYPTTIHPIPPPNDYKKGRVIFINIVHPVYMFSPPDTPTNCSQQQVSTQRGMFDDMFYN